MWNAPWAGVLWKEPRPGLEELRRGRQMDASVRGQLAQLQLAAILDSQEVAIISKSLDGVIQTWNPGAERIYGYTAQEAVGQSLAIIIPPESRNELAEIVERLKREEPVRTYESVRVRKDGSRFDA